MKTPMKARKGATFIEYAMLAGLVAVVVAIAVVFFGDNIKSLFTSAGQKTHQIDKQISTVDLKPNIQKPVNQD